MLNRDVIRSQSANFFKVRKITEEYINQRPERLSEETLATPSEILIEAPSKATLVKDKTVNINLNLLITQNHNEKTCNHLVIKLNRLKDKEARFESHKYFLTSCVNEGLVPKGLELMLESTIDKDDQIFLTLGILS